MDTARIAPRGKVSRARFARVLALVLFAAAGAAAWGWFVVRPAQRAEAFAGLARLEAESDCCASGWMNPVCAPLVPGWRRLASGTDHVATNAADRLESCPAAREHDPAHPLAADGRLCGLTFTPGEREAAALELARAAHLLPVLTGEGCHADGVARGLAVLARPGNERTCAPLDTCVAVLLRAPRVPGATAIATRLGPALVELLPALVTPANRESAIELLASAIGHAPETARAVLSLTRDPIADPRAFELVLGSDDPRLRDALHQFALDASGAAANRIALVRFARGEESLGLDALRLAVNALPCEDVRGLAPHLQLGLEGRTAAMLGEIRRCPAAFAAIARDLALTPDAATVLDEVLPPESRERELDVLLARSLVEAGRATARTVRRIGALGLEAGECAALLEPLLSAADGEVRLAATAAALECGADAPDASVQAVAEAQHAACREGGGECLSSLFGGAALRGEALDRLRALVGRERGTESARTD